MTRRLVVAVDGMTPQQERAFIKYLGELKCAWWHWIGNVWFISDAHGTLKPADLRNILSKKIAPAKRSIVIEVQLATGAGWAGYGPTGKEKNMFDWIRRNWKSD